ncbi:MAG: SGNH hydrolase domain-containing protein [Pseudomonadota bacterium]
MFETSSEPHFLAATLAGLAAGAWLACHQAALQKTPGFKGKYVSLLAIVSTQTALLLCFTLVAGYWVLWPLEFAQLAQSALGLLPTNGMNNKATASVPGHYYLTLAPLSHVIAVLPGLLLAILFPQLSALPGPRLRLAAATSLAALVTLTWAIMRSPSTWLSVLLPSIAVLVGLWIGQLLLKGVRDLEQDQYTSPPLFSPPHRLTLGLALIYCWYWPLHSFWRTLELGYSPIAGFALCLTAASFIALANARILPWKIATRSAMVACGSGLISLLAMLAISYKVAATGGLPERYAQHSKNIDQLVREEKALWWRNDCNNDPDFPMRCLRYGTKPQSAIIGDAFARDLFEALSNAPGFQERGLISFGRDGCPPLRGIQVGRTGQVRNCATTTEQILKAIMASDEISTVYIVMDGRRYFSAKLASLSLQDPQNPDASSQRVFLEGLDRTLKALASAKKRTIYVFEWPRLPRDPIDCLPRRPKYGPAEPAWDCHFNASEWLLRSSRYRALVNDVLTRHSKTRIWDTSQSFCSPTSCYAMQEQQLLYKSRSRLTDAGIKRLRPISPPAKPG